MNLRVSEHPLVKHKQTVLRHTGTDSIVFRKLVRELAQLLFFEASADSIAGMRAYLEALPSGPHAESAGQRRDALQAAARAEAGEHLSAAGAAIERRLAAAAQSREDVLTAYASWLGRLVDFDGWGRAIDEAKSESAGRAED